MNHANEANIADKLALPYRDPTFREREALTKVKHNKKLEKRCIKCRTWKIKEEEFGKHGTSSDGYQSICRACKNVANNEARTKDVVARLRHHIATRCATQLEGVMPHQFAKNLEGYLGYRIKTLVRHLRADLALREPGKKLRDALNEGYHVDHIKPLSRYPVVVDLSEMGAEARENTTLAFFSPLSSALPAMRRESSDGRELWVDWRVFQDCWRIENLSAIPAAENLAKGAKYDE